MSTLTPLNDGTTHKHARRQRGFTLIEILVVMFIIALVSGIALLSLGVIGSDSGLREEADTLANRIKLLSERAGLEAHDYGIFMTPSGYEVMRLNSQSGIWERMDDEPLLRPHRLATDLLVTLVVDGQTMKLSQPSADEAKKIPSVNQSVPPVTATAGNDQASQKDAPANHAVVDDSEGRDERFNKAFEDSAFASRWINRPPQIWILATGELTPFEWRLARANSPYQISVKGAADLLLTITPLKVTP
jgi:general secretion pathway protein H